ncbi:MAG TPA: hypothetical protein VMU82_10295 [Acetobacteraceae bacterium]|nr:hypothetical protein [Acetobacteraceae bacterium]
MSQTHDRPGKTAPGMGKPGNAAQDRPKGPEVEVKGTPQGHGDATGGAHDPGNAAKAGEKMPWATRDKSGQQSHDGH